MNDGEMFLFMFLIYKMCKSRNLISVSMWRVNKSHTEQSTTVTVCRRTWKTHLVCRQWAFDVLMRHWVGHWIEWYSIGFILTLKYLVVSVGTMSTMCSNLWTVRHHSVRIHSTIDSHRAPLALHCFVHFHPWIVQPNHVCCCNRSPSSCHRSKSIRMATMCPMIRCVTTSIAVVWLVVHMSYYWLPYPWQCL